MKTGSALLVCLTVLCLPGVSIGEERPVVAVFGIHGAGNSLDEDLLNSLTEYLAASVAECGAYRIVPPWDVQPALQQKKLDSGKECFDPECQLKLAAQLEAGLYVSTSITRTADTCTVVSALDDVKRQTQLISARARGDCSEPGLVKSIEDVAYFFILWGGCKPPGEEMPGVNESLYQEAAEADARQPAFVKERRRLPKVEEVDGEEPGSVSDVLVSAGWNIHTGSGHGIRFDGRLFLNTFVDIPVLKDLGFAGMYNTFTGYGLDIEIPDDLKAGSISRWQVEALYRMAFNQVLTRPAILFRFGYGGTGCLSDPGSRFMEGAEYLYPYFTLETYFTPYQPYLRIWASTSILFHVETTEDQEEGPYLGLRVAAGLDLVPTEYIYLGLGYELTRFLDEEWSSDIFVSFFLRAGCYYH